MVAGGFGECGDGAAMVSGFVGGMKIASKNFYGDVAGGWIAGTEGDGIETIVVRGVVVRDGHAGGEEEMGFAVECFGERIKRSDAD